MKTRASPNIALIKYWGKLPSQTDLDRNLATNASISLTLSQAQSLVDLIRLEDPSQFDLWINQKPASESDQDKVKRHWKRVHEHLGLKQSSGLRLRSANNFPAGTGMASSASSYAALTLAMVRELSPEHSLPMSDLSSLARRGSGSACRSLEGPWVKWEGRHAHKLDSDWKLRDTILILSSDHKKVPSSQGHLAATSSPFFKHRLSRLEERLSKVEKAIEKKSLSDLIPLVEEEAEELHKIVESSRPAITYKSDATRLILEEIRKIGSRDFAYTLDAGPNIHILSEGDCREPIEKVLKKVGIVAEVWEDFAGLGAQVVGEP